MVDDDPDARLLLKLILGALNAPDHGIQGYVRKPFEMFALLDTLDEVLRHESASAGG